MSTARKEFPAANIIDTDFKRSLLHSIALFRGVEPDEISDLLSSCGRIDIAQGETLLSPQRPNRCVYIVLSGGLRVHVGALDGAIELLFDLLPPSDSAFELQPVEPGRNVRGVSRETCLKRARDRFAVLPRI